MTDAPHWLREMFIEFFRQISMSTNPQYLSQRRTNKNDI